MCPTTLAWSINTFYSCETKCNPHHSLCNSNGSLNPVNVRMKQRKTVNIPVERNGQTPQIFDVGWRNSGRSGHKVPTHHPVPPPFQLAHWCQLTHATQRLRQYLAISARTEMARHQCLFWGIWPFRYRWHRDIFWYSRIHLCAVYKTRGPATTCATLERARSEQTSTMIVQHELSSHMDQVRFSGKVNTPLILSAW